jgi:zinc ribbon protein
MYCPRCATQNIDSARFCRSCGANLSLVPQALSGHLPEDRSIKAERAIEGAIKRRRDPNLSRGIRKSSLGLAFLTIVAVLFITRGSPGFGGIWLLIPAFILLGKGIAEIVTVLSVANSENQISIPRSAPGTNELSPQQKYESLTPPSVTEDTTRHMDPIPERRRESN